MWTGVNCHPMSWSYRFELSPFNLDRYESRCTGDKKFPLKRLLMTWNEQYDNHWPNELLTIDVSYANICKPTCIAISKQVLCRVIYHFESYPCTKNVFYKTSNEISILWFDDVTLLYMYITTSVDVTVSCPMATNYFRTYATFASVNPLCSHMKVVSPEILMNWITKTWREVIKIIFKSSIAPKLLQSGNCLSQ